MENTDTPILGFLEKPERPWELRCEYFPSKGGGFPAWLNPESLPNKKDLKCRVCGSVLTYMMQLYCPISEDYHSNEDTFHRTLFIFCCTNSKGKCTLPGTLGTIKVFRSQLPMINDYYDSKPPTYDSNKEVSIVNVKKKSVICVVCGMPGWSRCSACKKQHYCSAEHQKLDWGLYHKKECNQEIEITNIERNYSSADVRNFDEMHISVFDPGQEEIGQAESESDSEEELDEEEETKDDTKVFQSLNSNEAAKDPVFKLFQKRIKNDQDQVLRYSPFGWNCTPIWVSGTASSIDINDVPNCENCGSKRRFEFQLLPQFLFFLDGERILENAVEKNDTIWHTLVVYTCEKSCSLKKEGYTEEFIFASRELSDIGK